MYVLFTETTLQVKQLLALVKPSVDFECVDKPFNKYQVKSQLKAKVLEDLDDLEHLSFKIKKVPKANQRFKTEKCRQFYELGQCDYGDRCMFAHGLHEINTEVSRPRNYKTRMCTTYEFDGFCTFGSRCAFVHMHYDPVELLESTISGTPRLPMPENLKNKCRPEFYPSDILTRKPNREMQREDELLPSIFIRDGSRLSTFMRLTNTQK